MKKKLRFLSLVLSLVCLLSIVGCQSQPDPISSEEPSSVTADLPESNQEPVSSQVEEPVSSEPSVADSKPQPEVSSQPEPLSIPFTLHELNLSAFNISEDNSSKGDLVLSTFKIKPVGSLFKEAKDSFKVTLIRNAEELKQAGFTVEALDSTKPDCSGDQAAYFQKSALILVLAHHTSTTMDERFNSITRSGNQLTVHWSLMPFDQYSSDESRLYAMTDGSENMIYWLEVSRSDVEGVAEVIDQRDFK